jgi:sigma-B regulation protein RsbU (phosphoserine phosphatase)
MRKAFGSRTFISVSVENLPLGSYRFIRAISSNDRELTCPQSYWDDLGKAPICSGGLIGELIKRGRPTVITDLDAPFDPTLDDAFAEVRSMVAAPMYAEGALIGWNIIGDPRPDGVDATYLEQYLVRSNLFGAAGRYLKTSIELKSAKSRLDAEVDKIAKIHRAFLPASLPTIEETSIDWRFRPYDRAGGDYVRFVPLDATSTVIDASSNGSAKPDRWGIFVGDAAGHGPAAAVQVATLHGMISAVRKFPDRPAEFLEMLNLWLQQGSLDGTFVTAFWGVYDPTERRIQYAAAGHPPAFIKPASVGAIRSLDATPGFPLGIMDEVGAVDGDANLELGDTLVVYTDGIIDARSPEGEVFGVAGMAKALSVCSGDPTCVIDSIMARLRGFERSQQPDDDQTLLALQRSA